MKWNFKGAGLAAVIAISATTAYGAGFEKTIMWSAKWSAVGGAATAAIDGSDSVYYNPAGLIGGSDAEASINVSPNMVQTSGSQTTSGEGLGSDKEVKPIMGITVKKNLTKRLSFGLGTYVAGGTGTRYEGVDYSGVNSNYKQGVDVESDLKIFELGLSAAYELTNNWNVGATWRVSKATANFASAKTVSNAILFNTKLHDLEDTNYEGFRVGTQYHSDDKSWGVGASYRSEVKFDAKGTASGTEQLASNGALNALSSEGDAHAKTLLPQQVNLGGFYKYSNNGTLYAEYSWTEYSANREIEISGNLTSATLGGANILDGSTIAQNWKNLSVYRVGHEYHIGEWAVRTGYALTSQVTETRTASLTYGAPGRGHSVVAGTGTTFMNNKLALDIAGEYSWSSGQGTHMDSNGTVTGDYSANSYGVHGSMKYLF